MPRQRKQLFHLGLDARERAIVTAVAEREGISLAEATRRIIRSCVVGDELVLPASPPPPKKRRKPRAITTSSETNANIT